MPNDPKRLESRVRACWRVHACAAGLCAGAQIYVYGCGVGMPLALGGAWLAALAALPAAAGITVLCRRALARPARAGRGTAALYLLLALTLLGHAAAALSALISLVGQTLLVQARALWCAVSALAAVALCALTGGAQRLCFALRGLLPVLLLGIVLFLLPGELPHGLFPILGAGGMGLVTACLCMPGAASVLLMLLLPPPELWRAGGEAQRCPVPGAGFFLARVLPGAAAGLLLTFAACMTQGAAADTTWGQRLSLAFSGQQRGSLLQTVLAVGQLTALLLLCACLTGSAEQALLRALPGLRRGRAGLWTAVLLLLASAAVPVVFGEEPVLWAAPFLILPAAAVLLFGKRMGGKSP